MTFLKPSTTAPTSSLKVFGLACHSLGKFQAGYKVFRSKKALPPISLVYAGLFTDTIDKNADVVMVDGVQNAVRLSGMMDGQAVVIADSPVILNELEGIIPLDWDKSKSYSFNLKPIDYPLFQRVLKRKSGTNCNLAMVSDVHRLGLIVSDSVNESVLLPLNSLLREIDPHQKQKVRQAIAEMMAKGLPTASLPDLMQDRKIKLTALAKALLSRFVQEMEASRSIIDEATTLYLDGKAFARVIKGSPITPYEVRYFGKLKALKT